MPKSYPPICYSITYPPIIVKRLKLLKRHTAAAYGCRHMAVGIRLPAYGCRRLSIGRQILLRGTKKRTPPSARQAFFCGTQERIFSESSGKIFTKKTVMFLQKTMKRRNKISLQKTMKQRNKISLQTAATKTQQT